MTPPRPHSPLITCLLLAIGLGLGWWLRGVWAPPEVPATEENTTEGYSAIFQPPVERVPAPAREALQPSTDNGTPSVAPVQPADTAVPDPATQLREYLSQRAFGAAVGLYQAVDRQDRATAGQLRAIILDYLESYLREGDDDALTALAEAFLSVHYDDIDVLLLLARHQQASDYWAEAARTFQLVYAYSATQPGRRDTVNQAFEQFVRSVDDVLAGDGRWQSLMRFYETLNQLGLQRDRERLRLAELHLNYGDALYGQSLLEELAHHPTLGARATALLNNTTPPPVTERRSAPVGSVPLEALGSHYHLPLTLQGRQEVRLVVDTGASLTTLTQSAFDRLSGDVRFVELGPQLFNTASGTSRGMVYQVDSLQIGTHRLTDIHIAVLDFATPDHIDGLLGMNILSQFRFEVDQDNEVLLLQPR
ncbi:retropepsin-like aspartic protease [Marinimicrobium alkaliphilum]|uniref:retropepsin-like aspartic protease n=1 Tax=Marinimicrobium alkaliphilum TaxID=2202654 RepID=UPI000DB98B34|nr:retropepsin-like aspartic protease [Marinimicrobium alkaliphilum]